MLNFDQLTSGEGNWVNVFYAFLGGDIVARSVTLDDIKALAADEPAYKSIYQYRRAHQIFVA